MLFHGYTLLLTFLVPAEIIEKEKPSKKNKKKENVVVEVEKTGKKRPLILPIDTSIFALFLIVLLATFYVVHSTIMLHLGGTTVTKQPQWLTGQS
ncbi:hypothetical protein L2E82_48125 [Cichorium intybus]|uniref:Uncharacterized protein n=1 Tax=Cichorium intybus TaxID=13427 RepID=A0ACB8YYN2_CICIN|nr:hypothetical protein L2E82_48125 [Cichorium intybus]